MSIAVWGGGGGGGTPVIEQWVIPLDKIIFFANIHNTSAVIFLTLI